MNAQAIFKDPQDPENGDMVVLTAGSLDIYNKIDGARTEEPTTSLRKHVVGSVPVGQWTEIDGYWQEAPNVIISPKRLPIYFARGRLGKQSFTLGCSVSPSSANLKYQIYPSCTFNIGSGSSGTITVNEVIGGGQYSFLYHDVFEILAPNVLRTSPYYGSGQLTVSYGWSAHTNFAGTARILIYLETMGTSGGISRQLLTTDSSYASSSGTKTATSSISLGNTPLMWWLSQEATITSTGGTWYGQTNRLYQVLRLNSYSYTTTAETITNPTGEVFYLAIGR